MKFVFTKTEIETVINLIPAYHAGANIEKIKNELQEAERSGDLIETPMYLVSYTAAGYSIEIKEDAVVDSVNMFHRAIHPVIGDIKSAFRLLRGAFEMFSKKFLSESKEFNKKYGVQYRYDLYEIDDPEDANYRVIFGIAVPLNTKGMRMTEMYHFRRTDLDWDKQKSLDSIGQARMIASFNDRNDLRAAGDAMSPRKN